MDNQMNQEFVSPDLTQEVSLTFNLMEGEVLHSALSGLLGYDQHCLLTKKYEDDIEKRLYEAEIHDLKSLISRLELLLPTD